MTHSVDDPAEQAFRLARVHHQAGRLAEAEAAYRSALEANAEHPGALYGLGTLALQVDEYALAEQLIVESIALRGDSSEAWYHLGVAQQGQSHFDSAIVSYRRAVAINSALYEVHYQLAVCLQLSGELEKSLTAYGHAFAIRADDAIALTNFGIAMHGARRLEEAIAIFRRAVAIKPELAEPWLQLGLALRDDPEGDAKTPIEAIDALRRTCALAPANAKSAGALASALLDDGQIDAAIDVQRITVTMAPEDADGHLALAEMLLARGDYVAGYAEYEYRWQIKDLPWPRRRMAIPTWYGGDLQGQTVYLHAEQSIGDTIQFIRFLPGVAARNGKMVVEIQPALRRLFQNCFPDVIWISPGDALPPCDLVCPLLSLPRVLRQESSPPQPYLTVPADRENAWRSRVKGGDEKLSVGLVWAGSQSMPKDRARSLALMQLAPLAEISNVRFVSLQKGWSAVQAKGSPFPLTDVAEELHDFGETAAAMMSLDLIISVDTAIAHLAGALGKPVWTLLPRPAHWRWGTRGETTPSYPTMRLFRQKARGAWADVILEVVERLRALAARHVNP